MSKTSLSIQMLEILYSRGVVGISELARLLETNPRNIPEYKKELEKAGYIIDTIPGRYGGYVLNKKYIFPAAKLSESEKSGLMQGFEYLLSRNDFMRKDDYSKAMAKISSALMATDAADDILVANRFPLAMPEREIEERYVAISHCISNKTTIEIEYLSLSNEASKRVLHPYKLFMYNNAWFVIGFDEKSNDFRYFKLNRIQSFKLLNKPFRVKLTYNERDFIDEFGMKQNGEWYPIKLKITGKYAMLVKERIYGKNQTVEPIDKDTTILSVEMQNKEDILSFILGFGPHCEVLEPEWFREKIYSYLEDIFEKYKT